MRLFKRRHPFRLAWKWLFGRWRLQDKRYWNRLLRTRLLTRISKFNYYLLPHWEWDSTRERDKKWFAQRKREEKRLKNLAYRKPPFG